jgi:alpha-tubulin suppressor-like RCC1 family protein
VDATAGEDAAADATPDSPGATDGGAPDAPVEAGVEDAAPDSPETADAGAPDAPAETGAGTVTAVSVGGFFACELTAGGAVDCWGSGSDGDLGNGSPNGSLVPTPVTGLASGVAAISAGLASHVCAVTATGGVVCWGDNESGELGNDSDAGSSAVPVPVTGLSSGVVAVSAGFLYSCALTVAGGVQCWGDNVVGELGNGSNANSAVPVQVTGLTSGVTQVSAGAAACAVTTGGAVVCWGSNYAGQLGNDSDAGSSAVPVPVTGLSSGVTAVSAGSNFACALTAAGGVVCWGLNQYGELGNGSTENSAVPVPVSGLASGVTEVSAGEEFACALTAGGGVVCWGYNFDGELGNNTGVNSSVPVPVSGLTSGVTAISVGALSACALTATGSVFCWGLNDGGELGNGTTTTSPVRVLVSNGTDGGVEAAAPVPVQLVTNQSFPGSIVIGGSNVFWVSGSPQGAAQFEECAASGCNGQATAVGNSLSPTPDDLVVSASTFYWTSDDMIESAVLALPMTASSTASATRICAGNYAAALAVDSTNVYWASMPEPGSPGGVFQGRLSTCDSSSVTLASGVDTLAIAVDSTNVYFAVSGTGIESCAIGGCSQTPTDVVPDTNVTRWLVVDAQNLYWIDTGPDADTVYQCEKAACASTTIALATVGGVVNSLQVDSTNVYWAFFFENGGIIEQCAIGGCDQAPSVLATDLNDLYSFAVSPTWIAWTDAYSVWAVAR